MKRSLQKEKKEQRYVIGQEKERQAEFLADISHQWKTPITSLMLMTNLLEDAPAKKQEH